MTGTERDRIKPLKPAHALDKEIKVVALPILRSPLGKVVSDPCPTFRSGRPMRRPVRHKAGEAFTRFQPAAHESFRRERLTKKADVIAAEEDSTGSVEERYRPGGVLAQKNAVEIPKGASRGQRGDKARPHGFGDERQVILMDCLPRSIQDRASTDVIPVSVGGQ